MIASKLPPGGLGTPGKVFMPPTWLTVVLLAAFIGKLVFTFWYADRTFDFTDEGGYMLWYVYPDKDPHPFYYFHKIVLGVFPFVDWDVVSLRRLKMVSEVLVILALASAMYRFINPSQAKIRHFAFIFGFISLAFFSTWFSWIFYENDMTYLFGVVAMSLILSTINTLRPWVLSMALFMAGLITGLQFFNKFSTCILLLLAIPLILYLFKKGWRYQLVFYGGVLGGFGSFFLITGYTFGQWYQEYLDGYKYYMDPLGYHPLRLIWMYILILWPFPLLALSPLALQYLVKKILALTGKKVAPELLFSLSLMGLLVLYYYTFPIRYVNANNPEVSKLFYYWYFPLVSFMFFFLFHYFNFREYSRLHWLFIISFFLLPGAIFVGTSTPAALSLASFLAPWYALLCWSIIYYYKPAMQLPIVVIAFVSVFVFVANHVERPYWSFKPIYEPRVLVEGPKERLLLGNRLATFVCETKEILDDAKIEKGYPIVALHDLPGLVYLVGGYSPATPWYFNVLDNREAELRGMMERFNCLHVGRIRLFEERPPVFMINEIVFDDVSPCLFKHGFDLVVDYEKPKKVSNPTLHNQIHRFRKGASDTLLIFLPRRPYTQASL